MLVEWCTSMSEFCDGLLGGNTTQHLPDLVIGSNFVASTAFQAGLRHCLGVSRGLIRLNSS